MSLKIVDRRNCSEKVIDYSELSPGDVFAFINDPERKPHLKTKNHETFGATLYTAIPLFEDFDETVYLADSKVELLNAELYIYKKEG